MSETQGARPKKPRLAGRGPTGFMPGEKPQNLKKSLLHMLGFLAQFKLPFAAAIVFAIGSTAFNIIGPRILSLATTELFNGLVAKVQGSGGIDFQTIGLVLGASVVLYALSGLCAFVEGWLMTSVSQRSCYELRRRIALKIDRMPLSYFESNSVGDVLSRITNDVDILGQSLNQGITQLITSSVTVVGVLIMMFSINPLMTLITLVMVPISAGLVAGVVKVSQKHFRAQQELFGEVNGLVEETFSGFEVVKAYRAEERSAKRFDATNERLREAAWKSQFLTGLMQPIMNFVGNLGYVAVAISGSLFAARGIITVGDIQAFIQYVKNFTQPITQLTQVSNMLQQMAAAAERIFDFLGMPEEEAELTDNVPEDVRCDVEFDHVRFAYRTDTPVIKDFSARVSCGQTVALVGPTGAGKTTIVKLLMRFYDVDSGVIRIGGRDIRSFSRAEVRNMFGMVLQDTWLFGGTIRENIRYGDLSATDEQVEAAARAACVHHFITTLPEGYDTRISEDAGNISQGQRQLLTIARAFLANRRMLILDEATSSVDTRTEQRIQEAMDRLMRGRTSFVIAHRLSTITAADLILVIDEGDIVEQGTHEELLARGGFYADLYKAQYRV